MFGIILIVFGIASLAFSQTSPFYVIVGVTLIVLGIRKLCTPAHNTNRTHSNRSDYYGGSDCATVHTGTGMPEGAYLENGRYESFSGPGWHRDAYGNPCNIISGVTVERDIYGNYRFSDDDSYGNNYDSAEYGRYTMDYND